jgi:hypothetical protein
MRAGNVREASIASVNGTNTMPEHVEQMADPDKCLLQAFKISEKDWHR